MARKVTVVAHNVLPHEKQAVGKLLNPRLFNLADRIVVGAGEQAEMLRGLDIDADIKVVPHPVYDRFFINDDQSSLERYTSERAAAGIPLEEFYLVHLGLVREYKGVDILFRALAELKDRLWRLEIAGEFYDDYERYDKLINDLGLVDRVIVRNQYLSDDEMARMIAASDGVALPYRHATQSGVAMAALAGGAPLIATRTGALADIVDEDVNGVLADPGSVESLRDAIVHFMDTSLDTWRSRRNAIAEQARSAYTWDTLAGVVTGGEGG